MKYRLPPLGFVAWLLFGVVCWTMLGLQAWRSDEPRPIANPFEATLLAQPNRAPIRLVAPYRVTVGATAVQLTTSGTVNAGVCIKAIVPGQTMYLGVSSAVTTATGWPMTDNESLCLEVNNANQVWAIASAAAQSVAVLPFSRY